MAGEEITQLIEEIERPFGSPMTSAPKGGVPPTTLRARMATLADIIQARYDYAVTVNPIFRNKIAMPPVTLGHYINERVAGLRNDLTLHLEPVGTLKREETAADKMEVAEAHDLIMLDPFGFHRESIHIAQVMSMFWAGVLEMQDFIDPEQGRGESQADYNARFEKARKGWFPFKLVDAHTQTIAWTEHGRDPTSLARRFKLPLVDFMERYTDGRRENPEKMLKIFNEHYGFLAADEAQPYTGSKDRWSQMIDVCLYADAGKICHYVDMEESKLKDKTQRYRGAGEEKYDNPFGQVPLLLAEGVYYPHEEVAYRRAPMLASLVNTMHAESIIMSNWASQVANGGWPTNELPAEVGKALIEAEQQPPGIEMKYDSTTGMPIPIVTMGKFSYVQSPVDPTADKLFGVLQNWEQKTSPNSLLTDADASQRLGSIPSTTVLAQLSENNKMGGWAERSEANLWGKCLDMIRYARKNKLNSHRKSGDGRSEADWDYEFLATGQEKVKGQVVKRGTPYQITAQDLDGEYTRTIASVDNSAASRSARRQEAIERKAAGSILEREYLELQGIEDVSDFIVKKNAEALFQAEAPAIMTEARQLRLKYIAARDGRDPAELLAAAGVQPEFVDGEGQDMGTGPYRMGSPEVGGVGSSSASRSVTP